MREVEDTRRRLEDEIRELEHRLPAPGIWAKRAVGVLVGGGLTGATAWFLLRRRKKKKQTPLVTIAPAETVIRVIPEEWGERLREAWDSDELKGWLAIGAGLWLALRLMEVRQLRRLNRSLVGA